MFLFYIREKEIKSFSGKCKGNPKLFLKIALKMETSSTDFQGSGRISHKLKSSLLPFKITSDDAFITSIRCGIFLFYIRVKRIKSSSSNAKEI